MLVFLSLLSAAMAAPQVYNPYYGTYGMYGYPSYGYPMVQSPMAAYPRLGYPAAYPISYPGMIPSQAGSAATRGVVKLGNFLEINGKMEQVATATTTSPVTTVKGEFTIQQNGLFDLFSGGDAKFNAYVMSSTDLTGTNVYVKLGTGTSCLNAETNAGTATASAATLAMVNAPVSVNGFYITGHTKDHCIGCTTTGKTDLKGANSRLLITNAAGTVIGCSMMALQ